GDGGVTAADVNGDGRADLVVVSALGVNVLLGNGDGSFQAPRTLLTAGRQPSGAAVADFTGDGQAGLGRVASDSNRGSRLRGQGGLARGRPRRLGLGLPRARRGGGPGGPGGVAAPGRPRLPPPPPVPRLMAEPWRISTRTANSTWSWPRRTGLTSSSATATAP